jgi:parallel beta-helix repeat protein
MSAGDTVYVGPGLYREQVTVMNDGTPEGRLAFIADTTGQHTGDPPGVVIITGADPADESIFAPRSVPGVYEAAFAYPVAGVVEMDGPQFRYRRARDTTEHLIDKLSELEAVEKLPSSHFYDEESTVLYIHTSDGQPPTRHEIEIIRRGNGIGMFGKHYVTVIGFTFRHMGDAAISFFKGSSDGIAIDNTSWGGRQGIRVYNASNILIYGNTLFRNDNSGVYFAAQSNDGVAIDNAAYENIKGIRWSSRSSNALAIGNTVFDNREAGIAIEDVDHVVLRHNTMVDNHQYQLMAMRSAYSSESNCFQKGSLEQLTADFVFTDHYRTLAEYQRGKHQDLHSQEGGCGPLPARVDVRKLHAETMAYAERARRILSGSLENRGESAGQGKDEGKWRWFDWLFGW